MWVTLKGKHLTVKIDLERYVGTPSPFFLIFTVDEHLLLGACWKGGLDGANVAVHGFFQELLMASSYMLRPEDPKIQKYSQSERKLAEWDKFQLGNEPVVYGTTLNSEGAGLYYFCSTKDLARIYYHNELLEFTDCPEYEGKHKGVVEVPLKEFIEDVLKISREYLEKYAPVIEEIRFKHKGKKEDYNFLWELYQEVKELYEKVENG
ncbi:hypothetical protein FH039_04475 [Thermococcus indicus]|uniref:Uncharacterized protein n=1 Tax=Thermococcus indicus TaxID=2586643 RepID=A0A4Y5SJE3_9EURY|nr:hypothetical protein [Thermococcus indicus]QDA31003.1 hypothetical protein FH039_04475 [Thermococcus indicus]